MQIPETPAPAVAIELICHEDDMVSMISLNRAGESHSTLLPLPMKKLSRLHAHLSADHQLRRQFLSEPSWQRLGRHLISQGREGGIYISAHGATRNIPLFGLPLDNVSLGAQICMSLLPSTTWLKRLSAVRPRAPRRILFSVGGMRGATDLHMAARRVVTRLSTTAGLPPVLLARGLGQVRPGDAVVVVGHVSEADGQQVIIGGQRGDRPVSQATLADRLSGAACVHLLVCRAGGARLRDRLEPDGLAFQLQAAGVPLIVAPLWDIHLADALVFSRCWWQSLAVGTDAGKAFQVAMAETLNRNHHSADGIMQYGDWRFRLPGQYLPPARHPSRARP